MTPAAETIKHIDESGWRDGFPVKSTHSARRGPGLNSQCPCDGSQPFIISKGTGHSSRLAHSTHTCMQGSTHTKKKFLMGFLWGPQFLLRDFILRELRE